MEYGLKTKGAAKVKPSANSNWAVKHNKASFKNEFQRDKRIVTKEFAPELVQAAKFLGVHPRNLYKQIQLDKKLARFSSKYAK